ncbi:MAG: methyltransferase [Bacteroidales bacterium]|nr:methyltransferase [Bacteroidales bacterium]
MKLSALHDPMGSAILEYQNTGKAAKLRVLSSMFEEDEIPAEHLFRTEEEMPEIEKKALELAKGRILDIGAGAGCHSIALQNKGFEVTAVDISPLSCQAMKARGIKDVRCLDISEDEIEEKFDTILMLMNGTGIAGTVEGLEPMLKKVSSLLSDDGIILIDSSDLQYLYENEDGSIDIDLAGAYYGEVDYKMVYRNIKGKPFNWLYADFSLLQTEAEKVGLKCELVLEGEHYDYLAKISK